MDGPSSYVDLRGEKQGANIYKLGVQIFYLRSEFTVTHTWQLPAGENGITYKPDKPSYRFEITSSFLSLGKTIKVTLDLTGGKLYFNSDDGKKSSFEVMMRRTNPGGVRQVYNHKAVSFGRTNNYVFDFARWVGQGEACFHERCSGCDESQCVNLKNEYLKPK